MKMQRLHKLIFCYFLKTKPFVYYTWKRQKNKSRLYCENNYLMLNKKNKN